MFRKILGIGGWKLTLGLILKQVAPALGKFTAVADAFADVLIGVGAAHKVEKIGVALATKSPSVITG